MAAIFTSVAFTVLRKKKKMAPICEPENNGFISRSLTSPREMNDVLAEIRTEQLPATDSVTGTKSDDILRINVCGMVYETLRSTLEAYPSTLLGNEDARAKYFLESRNAYFFDRNRQCFEAILYYYHSKGTLIRPAHIPMALFEQEICFFGLGKEVYHDLQSKEGYVVESDELPHIPWQKQLWLLFEYPDSSFAARCMTTWSITIIIVSIIVFCMETMPVFQVEDRKKKLLLQRQNSTRQGKFVELHVQPWYSIELGCIIWFTVEYIVRFIASPSKWRFSKSLLNVIDLLAILPYYMMMSIDSSKTTPFSVLRVVRLVRVFRIFKLSRHSLGLQILGLTLKASIRELCMLIFFLFLGVILFSSAIFYAEDGADDFKSIPESFWYTLVTMTTVGYGDKVPTTLPGKLVGSVCAVCGVLTIALPVPVIVSNFEFFYKKDRLKGNQEEQSPSFDKRFSCHEHNEASPLFEETRI